MYILVILKFRPVHPLAGVVFKYSLINYICNRLYKRVLLVQLRLEIKPYLKKIKKTLCSEHILMFSLSSGFTYKYIHEALKKSFIIEVSYELTLYAIHSRDTVFWLIQPFFAKKCLFLAFLLDLDV